MPGEKIDCPYVGLAPFTEDQARFFFGRERDQQFVVANLFATRLTVLYGPSAAGKSSLLRAGVIRELLNRMEDARRLLGRADLLFVYVHSWDGNVHERVRAAVVEAVREIAPEAAEKIPADATLADLLAHAARATGGDVFVIFDQFEEYFLYQPEQREPSLFERALADAVTRRHLPVSFLIALRDDEIARLDRLKPLVPGLLANPVSLRRLTTDQARIAITAPVDEYNKLSLEERAHPGTFSVEPALRDAILEEVQTSRVRATEASGQHTAALGEIESAYLQLVMTALWQYEVGVGSTTLRRDTLGSLGGARAIVRRHFDEVMGGLSEDERNICAQIFGYLVTPSGLKIPHRLADLASYGNVSAQRLQPVVEKLLERRILTAVGSDAEGVTGTYAIRHDALGQAILAWRRRYVDERNAVAAAARQKVDLKTAQAQAEQERLKAEERAAANRRLQSMSLALTLLVGLVSILAVYAFYLRGLSSSEAARERVSSAEFALRAKAAVDEARASMAQLTTYRAEFARVNSRDPWIQALQSQTYQDALTTRVAELGRAERDRDDASRRLFEAERELGNLRKRIADLTRAQSTAVQDPAPPQQPIVIVQIRPRPAHE